MNIWKRLKRAYKAFKEEDFSDLVDIVDNGTTYVNVGKVFKGGEDITDEFFGTQPKRPATIVEDELPDLIEQTNETTN